MFDITEYCTVIQCCYKLTYSCTLRILVPGSFRPRLARIQNSRFDWRTRTDQVISILQNFRGVEKWVKILTTKLVGHNDKTSDDRVNQFEKESLILNFFKATSKGLCEVTFRKWASVRHRQHQEAVRWHKTAEENGKVNRMIVLNWIDQQVIVNLTLFQIKSHHLCNQANHGS